MMIMISALSIAEPQRQDARHLPAPAVVPVAQLSLQPVHQEADHQPGAGAQTARCEAGRRGRRRPRDAAGEDQLGSAPLALCSGVN